MKKIIAWMERYWWVVALGAGVAVFVGIRLLAVGQSIWFDEGYSILLARQPFSELFALTAVDAHPPLYYLLLKVWDMTFGWSEMVLRSLSALCMAGAVTTVLVLTKKLFGVRVMLVSVPFLVLAPFLLRYGYEVRMYALATLIGAAGTLALVKARESQRIRWWVLYAVLVALGMYTLYMMAAVWVAHVVWLVWVSLRARAPLRRWRWVWAYVGAVVLFLPYLSTFLYQFQNSALPGIGREVTLTTLVDVTTILTLFTPEWAMGGWLSILLGAVLLGIVILGVRVFRSARSTQRDNLLLYGLLATVPLLFFALLSLPPREPIFVVRYMAHVSIWLYALLGVIVGLSLRGKSKKVAYIVGGMTIGILCLGVGALIGRGNFIFERAQTPMTQQIRSELERQHWGCEDPTTVVADDPYTYIDSVYYFSDCTMHFFAKDNVEKKGGYAPLHDSPARISSSKEVISRYLIHLHWGEPSFTVDGRYKRISSQQFDKQHVDVYELIAE